VIYMEYCPTCRTLRNIRISELKKKAKDADGSIKEIIIKSYHCMSCGSFVRSEIVDKPKKL